jgi:hypothetical protein
MKGTGIMAQHRQVSTPSYFMQISVTTPIVSALKNYYT